MDTEQPSGVMNLHSYYLNVENGLYQNFTDVNRSRSNSPKRQRRRRKTSGSKTEQEERDYLLLNEGEETDDRSEIEILASLCRRLNGWIPKDEVEYIEEETGIPVYPNDRDERGCVVGQSELQQRIKSWRADRLSKLQDVDPKNWSKEDIQDWETSAEAEKNLNELADHLKKREETRKEKDPKSGRKNLTRELLNQTQLETHDSEGREIVRFSTATATLPHLDARLRGPLFPDREVAHDCLADTGGTASVINKHTLLALGYSLRHLRNRGRYTVHPSTWATKETIHNSVLGDIWLHLYLRASDGNFYRLKIKFVVMEGPISLMLGWRDMLRLNFNWYQYRDGSQRLRLDCQEPVPGTGGRATRKSFITYSYAGGCNLYNTADIRLRAGRRTTITLSSVRRPAVTEGFVEFDSEHMVIKPTRLTLQGSPPASRAVADWPKAKSAAYSVELSCISRESGIIKAGTLKIPLQAHDEDLGAKCIREAIEVNFLKVAEQQYQKGHNVGEPETLRVDAEDILLDKIWLNSPEHTGPETKELTDAQVEEAVTKLLEPVKDKKARAALHKIIMHRSKSISKGMHDIGCVRGVPWAKITPNTDKIWRGGKRRYTEEDKHIIQRELDKLEKQEVIEKTDGSIEYNSPLHLVSKRDAKTTLIERSKADPKQKLSQMTSHRIVLDSREMNANIQSTGALYLPRLEEVLTELRGAHLSSFDVKSAFWTVPYELESRKYTAFVSPLTNQQYQFAKMIMGSKTSPANWQRTLSLILSEENWAQFKKTNGKDLGRRFPELHSLKLSQVCLFYLDDVLLHSRVLEIHNFVVDFFLAMMVKFNLRWDVHKASVLRPSIQFLGSEINVETGEYYLSADRVQAFEKWSVPDSRRNLNSRLCCLSYFAKLQPSLKTITASLFLMARSKNEFKMLPCLRRVWTELKYLLSLNLRQKLVDPERPLLCTSDGSWLSVAGNAFQLDENKRLELVGSFSKLLPISDLGKSSLYREAIGLVCTLKNFEYLIRCNKGKVLIGTDSKALTFLRRLKSFNSRLLSYAVYISSFPQISIFHIQGIANVISDNLSRSKPGTKTKVPQQLNRAQMEKMPVQHFNKYDAIHQDKLLEVLLSEVPAEWVAPNTDQKTIYDPKSDAVKLEDILTSETTEQTVLDAALRGYDAVDPSHWLWKANSKNKNKPFSKAEFQKYAEKYDFNVLRETFAQCQISQKKSSRRETMEATEATEAAQPPVEEGPEDTCDSEEGKFYKFVKDLRKVVQKERSRRPAGPSGSQADVDAEILRKLERYASHYLLRPGERTAKARERLISLYQDSALYHNTQGKLLRSHKFLPISVDSKADVEVVQAEPRISLALKEEVEIAPLCHIKVKLATKLTSPYGHDLEAKLPKALVTHLDSSDIAGSYWFENLFIHNPTSESYRLKGEILTLKTHYTDEQREECDCHDPAQQRLWPVLLPSDADQAQQEDTDANFREAALLSTVSYMTEISASQEETQEQPTFSLDFYNTRLLESSKRNARNRKGKPRKIDRVASVTELTQGQKMSLNRMLMLSKLLDNSNVMSSEHMCQLQHSCVATRRLIGRVRNATKETDHVLRDNVLYKLSTCPATGVDFRRIVLPDYLARLVLTAIHHRMHMHSSAESVEHMFNAYFSLIPRTKGAPSLQSMINEIQNDCGTCLLNTKHLRHKFTGTARTIQTSVPGYAFACDVLENLPRCKRGYKYALIQVCLASGFVIVTPLKTLQAQELTEQLEIVWSLTGGCEQLELDAAPFFRSEHFRRFCRSHRVSLRRPGAIGRSKANRAENYVKIVRDMLTNHLCNDLLEDRREWSRYIPSVMRSINALPVLSHRNKLSRQELFFGGGRRLNLLTNNEAQQAYLQELQRFRTQRALTAHGDQPLRPELRTNNLVRVTRAKEEQPTREGARGLQASSSELARIDNVDHAGANVTLLQDNSKLNVDQKKLAPVSLNDSIRAVKDFPLSFDGSHMAERLPQMRKKPTLFESILQAEKESKYEILSRHEYADPADHIAEPADDSLTQENNEEEPVTTVPRTLESDIIEEERVAQEAQTAELPAEEPSLRRSSRDRRAPDRYGVVAYKTAVSRKAATKPINLNTNCLGTRASCLKTRKKDRVKVRKQVVFGQEHDVYFAKTDPASQVALDRFDIHTVKLKRSDKRDMHLFSAYTRIDPLLSPKEQAYYWHTEVSAALREERA